MNHRQNVPSLEEQLASPIQQARLLGLLLDGASSLVGLTDRNHRYLFANQPLESLCGVPHGGLVGRTAAEALSPEQAAEIHAREDSVIARGEPAHFVERLRINGHLHVWETIRFPFRDLSGNIAGSGFVAIDRDEDAAPSDTQREILARAKEQTAAAHMDRAGLMRLAWRPAYECRNPTIDRQHRMLFDRSNQLLQAIVTGTAKPAIQRLIKSLTMEILQHFRDEETLIRQAGFPHVTEHHDIHMHLLARLTQLSLQFDRDQLLIEDLFAFLSQDVICRHMLRTDREFFAFFNASFPLEP